MGFKNILDFFRNQLRLFPKPLVLSVFAIAKMYRRIGFGVSLFPILINLASIQIYSADEPSVRICICPKCNDKFRHHSEYTEHRKTFHSDIYGLRVMYACTFCGRSFKDSYLFRSHLASCKVLLRYECKICSQREASICYIQEHVERFHGIKYRIEQYYRFTPMPKQLQQDESFLLVDESDSDSYIYKINNFRWERLSQPRFSLTEEAMHLIESCCSYSQYKGFEFKFDTEPVPELTNTEQELESMLVDSEK